MGVIKEVLYEMIPEHLCTKEQASASYYHQNVIGLDPMFRAGYEQQAQFLMDVQRRMRAEAIQRGYPILLGNHPESIQVSSQFQAPMYLVEL